MEALSTIARDMAELEYRQAVEKFYEIKREYEFAEALAYPETTGTVEERKMQLRLRMAGDGWDVKMAKAEATLEGVKAAFRVLSARMSAAQSALAALREEAKTSDFATQG